MTFPDDLDILGSKAMMNDHLLGYRQYSTDELTTERTTLRAARSTFISQSMGSKSFQRDLRLLEERLQAVNFVIRERGYVIPENDPSRAKSPMVGSVDFSQIK